MEKHKIRLHHEKDYDGKHRTAMKCIQHICGVKSHVLFDPHGLDGMGTLFDDNCPYEELGEIIIDCEKPIGIELKYTFENSDEIYDMHKHRNRPGHYTAMVNPENITGNLILVY